MLEMSEGWLEGEFVDVPLTGVSSLPASMTNTYFCDEGRLLLDVSGSLQSPDNTDVVRSVVGDGGSVGQR